MLNTNSVIDRILSSEDYYVILDIGRDASQAQIRQQYLKASLKVHPDKCASTDQIKATKAFVKLKEAYETLFVILTRKQYDTTNPKEESSHPDDFQQGEEAARQHEEKQKKSPEDYPRRKQEDQRSQQQEQQQRRRQEEQQRSQQQEQQQRRRQEEQQRKQRQEEQRRQQEEWQRRREEQERRRQQQDAERRQQEERRRRQEEQQKREEEQRMWRDQMRREERCRQQEERQRQYHEQQRTFGRTMTGEPCKRCIQWGCYCYQHKTQDPAFRGRQPTSSTAPGYGSLSDQYGTRHFGINKSNGEPCKVCINQRGFCHHHKDQDPQIFCHRALPSLGRSKASPQQQQYAPYGRRQDGQSCKLCEKKQGFCHFHINQRC